MACESGNDAGEDESNDESNCESNCEHHSQLIGNELDKTSTGPELKEKIVNFF